LFECFDLAERAIKGSEGSPSSPIFLMLKLHLDKAPSETTTNGSSPYTKEEYPGADTGGEAKLAAGEKSHSLLLEPSRASR